MPIIVTRDNGDLLIPGPQSGQPRTPSLQRLFVSGQHAGPKLMPDGLTPQPKKIIVDDDRQRRTDTDQPPLRMICSIAVSSSDDEEPTPIGTGWLVGRKTVVTAGHVLRWQDDGREAMRVVVTPGRDRDRVPFGRFESRRFHYHPDWHGSASDGAGHDIAAIALGEPLGDTLGFFGIGALIDATLGGRVVNIPGYPGEVEGHEVVSCTELWWHANHLQRLEADRIFYDVDTSPGQSGAPVILWPDPTSSLAAPLVVGVHTRSGEEGRDENAAVRINAGKLALIGSWIDADANA